MRVASRTEADKTRTVCVPRLMYRAHVTLHEAGTKFRSSCKVLSGFTVLLSSLQNSENTLAEKY